MRTKKNEHTINFIHYNCPSPNAPGTFVTTRQKSSKGYADDRTIIFKCNECGETIGVERNNKYMPNQISVYICSSTDTAEWHD